MTAAELQADVERDQAAVAAVLGRYGRYLDDKRLPELAELFTDDATVTLAGQTVTGRDALLALLTASVPPATSARPSAIHLLSNVVVDVAGDHASATSDWVLIARHATGEIGIVLAGRYDDELRRVDGRWLITVKAASVLSRTKPTTNREGNS